MNELTEKDNDLELFEDSNSSKLEWLLDIDDCIPWKKTLTNIEMKVNKDKIKKAQTEAAPKLK